MSEITYENELMRKAARNSAVFMGGFFLFFILLWLIGPDDKLNRFLTNQAMVSLLVALGLTVGCELVCHFFEKEGEPFNTFTSSTLLVLVASVLVVIAVIYLSALSKGLIIALIAGAFLSFWMAMALALPDVDFENKEAPPLPKGSKKKRFLMLILEFFVATVFALVIILFRR